jgi:ribonuclease HI
MSRRPRRKGGSLRDGERRRLALTSRQAVNAASHAPGDRVRLLCDGGSRGNPGPAAIAAVLLAPDGHELERRSAPIGHATAAEAEYRAILLGLELAGTYRTDPIEVCSDSRLAIAAVRGATPADPVLAVLVREIRDAAHGFGAVRWTWHPRAENAAADALVQALLW